MSKKKKITISHLLSTLIIVLVIFGFLQSHLTLQFGKHHHSIPFQDLSYTSTSLLNITGTLITTPHLESSWIDTVSQTQNQLIGQVYNLTNRNIKTLLTRLGAQNTTIRMILENRQFKSFGDNFSQVQQEFADYPSIQFKSDDELNTQYMHSKFRVTDTHAIIQTANLTYGGLNESKEHQFVSTNPHLRQALTQLFYDDRNQSETNPAKTETGLIKSKSALPNLLICPYNCRSGLETLLTEAQESIIIRNQYITDQSIRNILKQQKRNGLDMQLLVSNNDSNTDLIRYFDHDTVRQVTKPYMHTKTMLIDHKYLIIGSINFSSNSMDNNREIAIILIDPSLIDQRTKDFNYYRDQG